MIPLAFAVEVVVVWAIDHVVLAAAHEASYPFSRGDADASARFR